MLVKNKKEKYIELCKKFPIPIFSQWFWLDAICGKDNWDIIIIEEDQKVLATLPYMVSLDKGNRTIQKLPLTQNNGIHIYYKNEIKKYEKKVSFEMKVIDLVINELEKLELKSYRQYFHYSFTNWLPFYWRGYKQTTRYTYVLEDTSNIDIITKNFNGNIRTALNKARKMNLIVKNNINLEIFYSLVEKTYLRQGIKIPFSKKLFSDLCKTLIENEAITTMYVIDRKQNIHSAVLFVEDSESVYYLMSGSDEIYRESQSLTLLIYEGILLAHKKGKKFDFEGSMKKNIELFFRQFGGTQKAYYDISKDYFFGRDV